MTRKRLLLATVGIVALLSVAITGLIYAGPLGQENEAEGPPIPDHGEQIGIIIQEQEGDDTVIATVNGLDFTTYHLRVGYESHMVSEPALTRDEAIKAVILSEFDDMLLTSVAESKGITTTTEEATNLVSQTQATCESSESIKSECKEVLSSMGLDYDEYWSSAVSVYQEQHTILKAMSTLRGEYVEENSPAAEGEDLDWLAIQDVRGNANVVWNDDSIKALFDQAHAERAEYLEQVD